MKKLFYPMIALAAMAMTTSCSDELDAGTTNSNEVTVSFNVQLENATSSRALIGDGTTAKELQYAVYKADGTGVGTIINALSKETTIKDDLTAKVTFTLVKGQTYNFMFWAQKPGTDDTPNNAYYTVDKANGKITINYAAAANDEGRDAFYAVEKAVKVTGPINKTITLKRPFAQINVGTSIGSLADAATADVKITKSNMTIKKAANELNVYDGTVSATNNAVDVTYTLANIPELTEAPADDVAGLKNVTVNNETKDYEYLAMNYILVDDHNKPNGVDEDGAGKNSVNVDFTIYDDNDVAINTFEVPNVTVQRNWRTNIIGDIMNESVTFNIVVDPKFDNDYNYDADQGLAFILANGGTYTLQDNVTLTDVLTVTKNMVINLNGKTLQYNGDDRMFKVENGATLTINGDDKSSVVVNSTNLDVATTAAYIATVYDKSTLIINGGSHTTNGCTLYHANGGKIIINSGEFDATEKGYTPAGKYGYKYALNVQGGTVANARESILVYGGVFKNFDPGNNAAEGAGTNFVAEGYKSVVNGIATENIFYVTKASSIVVKSINELNHELLTIDAEVALVEDVTATETVNMALGTSLDGVGNTMILAADDDGTYARGISTKGGTIKNLIIDGENKKSASKGKGYRAIFIENATDDVVIDNVSIKGVAYTMNTRGINAADNLKLFVKNSTLVGWTSYENFASALFYYCHFGVGSYYDAATIASNPGWNGCIRPYDTTTLNNCTFDAGFILMLDKLAAGETITLKNCKVGNVVVTKDNIENLLGVAYNDQIIKF